MRRLVIFINGDFTLLENGSQVRMAEQVAFARAHFAGFAVYSHRQHPSHPWTAAAELRFAAMFPGVELIVESLPAHVRLATRIRNAVLALWPGGAGWLLSAAVPGGPPRYRTMCARGDILLWINFVDGCSILNGLPEHVVVETHDIRFVKQAKRHGLPVFSLRIIGKMRSEIAMLGQARALVTISPADTTIIEALTGACAFFVPSYHVADAGDPLANAVAKPSAERSIDLLFVGANNNFNVDGITRFLAENRSWLAKRTIAIAGRVCEAPRVQELARDWPGLALLGFVSDLSSVYAQTRAVLSPVDGTGLKIKVVEALAHGKPVFASAHSREALPKGYERCVFTLDRGPLEQLLDDPVRLATAERAARDYDAVFKGAGDRSALLAFLTEQLAER